MKGFGSSCQPFPCHAQVSLIQAFCPFYANDELHLCRGISFCLRSVTDELFDLIFLCGWGWWKDSGSLASLDFKSDYADLSGCGDDSCSVQRWKCVLGHFFPPQANRWTWKAPEIHVWSFSLALMIARKSLSLWQPLSVDADPR